MRTPHLTHPKYRADIDGLRAIAVLSVVGFHAFPTWVRGGFIGVDIFFVISGYLISIIIFENLEGNRFSFIEFYIRRIKRIFPVLILVLTACFAFGWMVLYSEEFSQLGKHIMGGAGFISNLLSSAERGYFDNAAETKPLLHLWSLGIEEQFYIIWPLLLWFSWKRKFNLLFIIILIATLSFAFNIMETNVAVFRNPFNITKIHNHLGTAFYSPLTRFWELLIGGVLAYINLYRQGLLQKFKSGAGNLQSIGGAALLIVGNLLITKEAVFPGCWALLPTIGAVLIISGGPHAWLNRRILSNRLFVWFGLISYPLYLWHWPILSFAHILAGGVPTRGIRIAAVIMSVLLAWLTYEIIEKPIRRSPNRKIILGLIFGMLLLFTAGAFVYLNNGLVYRKVNMPFKTTGKVFEGQSNNTFIYQSDHSCKEIMGMKLIPEEVCITTSRKPKILFVGDSFAMSLFTAIYAGKTEFADQSILISGSSCRPYASLNYTPTFGLNYGNNCTDIAKEELRIAKTIHSISTVIIVNADPGVANSKKSIYRKDGVPLDEETAFVEGNGYFINDLLKSGKKVIYNISPPVFKNNPVDCETRISFIEPKEKGCQINESEFDGSRKVYMKNINLLKARYPLLKIFDSTGIFCNKGICAAKDDKGYLYRDLEHLNMYGSQKVLDLLLKKKLID